MGDEVHLDEELFAELSSMSVEELKHIQGYLYNIHSKLSDHLATLECEEIFLRTHDSLNDECKARLEAIKDAHMESLHKNLEDLLQESLEID